MILRDSQKPLCRNILSLFNRKSTSESSKKYLLTGLIPSTGILFILFKLFYFHSLQVIALAILADYELAATHHLACCHVRIVNNNVVDACLNVADYVEVLPVFYALVCLHRFHGYVYWQFCR